MSSLPDELWLSIIKYSGVIDYVNVSLTCKRFHNIANSSYFKSIWLHQELLDELNRFTNINKKMSISAKYGDKDLVDFFITKGADDWNWGIDGAAKCGHKELVEFFIAKGANHWEGGMRSAALDGHKDLVEFFIAKGANHWNWGMMYAAKGGHNWNDGIYCAALGGHKDLVDFFRQKNINA